MKASTRFGIGLVLAVVVVGLLGAGWAQAGTIYVSTAGNDANDGQSWAGAKKTVQAGLNAAVSGDQVWVAAGTYVQSVTLRVGVALYGGFVGTETDLAQRDWFANNTILDGNQAGSVVIAPSGVTSATQIDGFTIRNGSGTILSGSYAGGGIYCSSASPTIANNTITGNSVTGSSSGYPGYGGGIYCASSSSPMIINNTITGNSVSGIAEADGAGIYCKGSSPTIINNVVSGNIATGSSVYPTYPAYGAGIYCTSSSPTITNNTFANNIASSGGAIYCVSSSSAVITGNTFTGNSATGSHVGDGYGGGIYCKASSPTITNNTFTGNSATSGSPSYAGYGGGIYCTSSSSPAIADNTIMGNSAYSSGGGIYCYFSSSPTITNNTITGNAATGHIDGDGGGGIFCRGASALIFGNTISNNSTNLSGGGIYSDSPAKITNNTIKGNKASTNGGGGISCRNTSGATSTITNNMITGNVGCGIYCYYASPTILSNTITGNTGSLGGGIRCDNCSPTIANTIIAFNSSGIFAESPSKPSLRYNCVYGNTSSNYSGLGLTDPSGVNGNISVDPKLADMSYGNGHLQPDSPCIDAGDDSLVQVGWLDVDGQTRILAGHVDIGADESDGTVWPGGPNILVRVSPAGNDANDGSSWPLAKRTVQAGIDAAAAAHGEVWVQAGTYLERVTLRDYGHVYGGFVGIETQRTQRNWSSNATVLDGGQGGSVVTATKLGCRLSTIDGFTIRNGSGTMSGSYPYGGGIYCESASPIITNNTITGNNMGGNYGGGGGVYCLWAAPMITNNTISNNSGYYGGGVYCNAAFPLIANNIISGNSTDSVSGHGGGIYCESYCYPLIANNTIVGNIATSGGGIYCYNASVRIVNTIIAFNSSGVYVNNLSSPPVTLRNNCLYGNAAYGYAGYLPAGASGNLFIDPKLVSVGLGRLHIQPSSPCVDAGDDTAIGPGWTDMDGQARTFAGHVDIGADESDGTVWPASPNVIVRVAIEGNDANDGASWSAPKQTVQAAIDAAAASGGGEVWVKAGSYSQMITLRNYVHVYGGFAGTETERTDRDWTQNITALRGSQGGSVVTASKIPPTLATLDGFGIHNGGTDGIHCVSFGSPVIANNVIAGNTRGVFCDSYASPYIVNNSISINHTLGNGGGICCTTSSSPTIKGNTVSGNTASSGGGIYCQSTQATVVSNLITGNSAANGGGLWCADTYGTATNNVIAGNVASASGGGIYVASGTIANSKIVGNRAASGGGIYCDTNSGQLISCSITGNTASGDGGGICCGWSSHPAISNTVVAFNSSGIYGGAYVPALRYGCVFGNGAYNFSGLANPTGTNGNISADPRLVRPASPGVDGAWGTADDDYGDLHLLPGSPCIDAGSNADVPADLADLNGNGNTSEPLPFDLAGASRFADDPATADTGSGTAPIVDIGAYEYLCGDVSGDGHVDIVDLLYMADAWGSATGEGNFDPDCDFNRDGSVDIIDLLYMANHWGM